MWHHLIKKSELEIGKPRRVIFQGRPIGIYVNEQNAVYVFSDVCTHEDGTLSEGFITDDKVIECPRHGARFDMATGKVLALPATEDIKTYPTKIEGEDIFVEWDSEAEFIPGVDDIGLPEDEDEKSGAILAHVCSCGGQCGCQPAVA